MMMLIMTVTGDGDDYADKKLFTWEARELVRLVHTLPRTELGAANWLTLVKPLTRLIFTTVNWPAVLPRTKMASSSWVRWEQAKEGRRVVEGQERVCWCSLALAALASASTETKLPSCAVSSLLGCGKERRWTLPTVGTRTTT